MRLCKEIRIEMKKYRSGGWAGLAIAFVVIAVLWGVGTTAIIMEERNTSVFLYFVAIEAVFVLLALVCMKKAPLRTDEEIIRMEKQAAQERQAEKEAREREHAVEDERKRQDTTPVAAVLISVQSEYGKKIIGTAARGLIGAALGGTFGAAVGIAAGRAKGKAKTATFSVKYESGRKGLETVNVNTPRFKELAALLLD